jgi:flagellar basal-body rod protein FlgC
MFKGFRIAASGMSAQRVRLNLVSSNLANANTTRTEEGGPYKRMRPVFSSMLEGTSNPDTPDGSLRSVEVVDIEKDETKGSIIHDPSHPDADENGNVEMPNVNVMEEMVDMVTASRSFEANVQAFTSLKEMVLRSLDIGR